MNHDHKANCRICQERATVAAAKEKRTSVYIMPPSHFEISGCKCGNKDPEWSEYKELLWCANCQIDFAPDHWGIIDGPVPVKACLMMGLNFDRFNLETNLVERAFEKERISLGMPETQYSDEKVAE